MEEWRKEYISHFPQNLEDFDPSEPDCGGTFEDSQFRKFLTWLEKAAEEGFTKEEIEEIFSALKKGIERQEKRIDANKKALEEEQGKLEESKRLLKL